MRNIFDTSFDLAGQTVDDEDLVRRSGAMLSIFLDGSAAGVAAAIDLDAAHYVDVDNQLVAPVDTSIPGIFVCGCADGPKDIPDSVTAGSAAAMRATIVLSKADEE